MPVSTQNKLRIDIEMPRINSKHVLNRRRKYNDHVANQHRKALNRRCEKQNEGLAM